MASNDNICCGVSNESVYALPAEPEICNVPESTQETSTQALQPAAQPAEQPVTEPNTEPNTETKDALADLKTDDLKMNETKTDETPYIEPKYIEQKVLAVIDVISDVFKHPDADSLWIARVQGWDVVINLTAMFGADATPENVVGRKIVYIQIDSVMPETFKDMALWKYLSNTYMGKKVMSAKLRGVVSQGIILDFKSLTPLFTTIDFDSLPLDTNVTNDLGIIKFYSSYDAEGPVYFGSYDRTKIKVMPSVASLRPFPDFLQVTDQERLQAKKKLVKGLDASRTFTATQKFDGQSVQWFYKDGRVGVCSRSKEVLLERDLPAEKRDKANNKFRDMEEKYSIFAKLTALGKNVAIQTEMYGMGINGNRHKKNDVDIAVFDVYDIDHKSFLKHADGWALADSLGLPTIPIVFLNQPLLSDQIEPWLALANSQQYAGAHLAEGIVVRTSDGCAPYVSFKVISQEFLLKYKL